MAYIVKRDNKDGTRTYLVRQRIDGRVVTKAFRRSKDADKYKSKIEVDNHEGRAVDPRNGEVTLNAYFDSWAAGRRIAPSTRALYGHLAKHFGALGGRPIGKITPDHVRRWHASIERPVTAAKAYRLLAAMMRTAVDDGLITASPCKVKNGGKEISPERPLVGPEHVAAIAGHIGSNLAPLVYAAAFGALRFGELRNLRRADVDTERGTVRVVTGKTASASRTVDLPASVVAMLAAHLGGHESEWVFPAASGGKLPPSSFYPRWRRACAAAGVPGLHVHDLRHAGAVMAAQQGMTVRELQDRLGHASAAAAMRYQHTAEARGQVIARALDALVVPPAHSTRTRGDGAEVSELAS